MPDGGLRHDQTHLRRAGDGGARVCATGLRGRRGAWDFADELLKAPNWRGVPVGLDDYGDKLAEQVDDPQGRNIGEPTDYAVRRLRWDRDVRPTGSPRPKGSQMALYMDVHNLDGSVTLADVAAAHAADLAIQDDHGVHYLRYWVSEDEGKIFCLVDAPDPEAANTVHRESHGLVADKVFLVAEGV